jgi:hypothetical protein
MGMIPAYVTGFDISASVSFFDRMLHVVTRKFYLRNLRGESREACTEEASQIMSAFGTELHYVTRTGIDKITIRAGGRKVNELVLGYEPAEDFHHFFWALRLDLRPAYSYVWQDVSGVTRWAIPKDEIGAGWQRTAMALSHKKKGPSFTIPCYPSAKVQGLQSPIVHRHIIKRKRKKIGWYLTYDDQDAVIRSFLGRFVQAGNLAFGDRRYFGLEERSVSVSGVYMKTPRHKEPKVPRKSQLASQPTDDTDYVYVIRMGRNNIFKIGKTNDPKGRLLSLQTASPYKLSMTNVFQTDNASAAEESLHAALMSCRLEGEWFRLTNELAAVKRFQEGRFVVGSTAVTADELLER